MDYRKLGFRAGLEIHQQLDTHKLFCKCPSALTDGFDYSFERELVPTRSELGGMDRAALAEAGKKKRFIYMASSLSTCLVEADEEPPHNPNQEAIDICLTVALMLNAKIVDELHFMRKIVIDGSTTSGFQRTALIALGGKVEGVNIETICLEEDAARRIGEKGNVIKYALDRLGIPLIEITTSPEIKSPEEAEEVAFKIGKILRATKKVKRGIGTIRQDLNVSIKGGNRVEIKGVQELRSISKILKNEVERQLEMVEVKKILHQRTTRDKIEKAKVMNVGNIFANSKSKVVGKGTVMAARLPGFKGLIGGVKSKKNCLGKEFAAAAEAAGGIIIHSDELPNYGISREEVEMVRKKLGCHNIDAFVISPGKEKVARACIKAVIARAAMAFDMKGEVRKALPDGTTKYMRPIAGAERMYPETDVPPVFIESDRIKRLRKELPETFEEKILRYEKYGLGKDEAEQIVHAGKDELFDLLMKKHELKAKTIARILLHILPDMERKGHYIKNLARRIDELLEGLERRMFSRDGLYKIMECWMEKPDASLNDIIKECGMEVMSEEDLRKEIKSILKEHKAIVAEKGEGAISLLMGIAMEKMRGKADGSLIYQILKEEVKNVMQENSNEIVESNDK